MLSVVVEHERITPKYDTNTMGKLVKSQIAAVNHLIILGTTVLKTVTSHVFIFRNFGRNPQTSYLWLPKIAHSPS